MPFEPLEPGIEVNGESINAVIDAFNRYPTIGLKCLIKSGILKKDQRLSDLDPKGWYPQAAWLRSFRDIIAEVGPHTVFSIGKKILDNAVFPPHVQDIHSGLQSLDAAFHLNHRKKGVVMFDPMTGMMQEGIGHYGYEAKPDERKIVSHCENPYPCDFDRGIVTAMALKFQPNARTTHEEGTPCRKNGGKSCTYVTVW